MTSPREEQPVALISRGASHRRESRVSCQLGDERLLISVKGENEPSEGDASRAVLRTGDIQGVEIRRELRWKMCMRRTISQHSGGGRAELTMSRGTYSVLVSRSGRTRPVRC
jgi:hypothetical protein